MSSFLSQYSHILATSKSLSQFCISSNSLLLRRLFCLVLLSTMTTTLFVEANNAKFLLSCRVISGICQGDPRCLDEMSSRFPDCYLESQFDLLPAKASEMLLEAPVPVEDGIPAQQWLEKRTPALKLMKVLMMKDRIPVGRR